MSTADRLADGYEPNFDLDVAVGRQGELFVAHVVDSLLSGAAVEVKNDKRATDTGNVYLEYQCLYGGEFKLSGIATTQSDLWVHVIADQVAVVAPTWRWKEVARGRVRDGHKRELNRGSHPTKGALVPMSGLLNLLVAVRSG